MPPDSQENGTSAAVGRAAARAEFAAGKPRLALAVCGFLLLAVIAVFSQTAWHGFVNYDDADYVFENWHVKQGLRWEGASWAMTASKTGDDIDHRDTMDTEKERLVGRMGRATHSPGG
ncbi:MAG: hypothetical protein ABMA01_14085 [Chthoniobacteraceae bacterium]